jgi:RHS repeat-associated protein
MGFYTTATVCACREKMHVSRRSLPAKTDPPSKNRVWGFSATSRHRACKSESQVLEPQQENQPTPTTTASGVHYYGYRYYSAEMGRWVNMDPIGERGGINVYNLGANGIVNALDRLGMEPIDNVAKLEGLSDSRFDDEFARWDSSHTRPSLRVWGGTKAVLYGSLSWRSCGGRCEEAYLDPDDMTGDKARLDGLVMWRMRHERDRLHPAGRDTRTHEYQHYENGMRAGRTIESIQNALIGRCVSLDCRIASRAFFEAAFLYVKGTQSAADAYLEYEDYAIEERARNWDMYIDASFRTIPLYADMLHRRMAMEPMCPREMRLAVDLVVGLGL